VTAAILGEILFTATISFLGLTKCARSMDRWEPGVLGQHAARTGLLI
jgi:hypothetical protein